MAELRNDTGALRFAVELLSRGAPPAEPPGAGAAGEPRGSLLARAGMEYLDRRDGEWWPLVRLPVLHLPAAAPDGLAAGLSEFLRGGSHGFSWRPGDEAPVGLQIGATPGGAIVEVGLDLAVLLADAAGVARRPNAELALFRYRAAQGDLVRFADALARELEALRT